MALRLWVEGARPRTLPAALVPVLVGTAVAQAEGDVVWWRVVAALVVSLAIQVGTNYANDYSDGVRGTDADRVGPVRLVGSGLVAPGKVKVAAMVAFAVAALAGLALAAATTWWLVLVGAVCLAAGWLYTGGPRPYGYAGLGEAFVFVFFGLIATMGSAYVHEQRLTALALFAAIPVGLLATAILVANNLRDIPTDRAAGKHTLAVRLGEDRTRQLYQALVYAAVGWPAFVAAAFVTLPPALGVLAAGKAVSLVRRVQGGAAGADLVPVLVGTGQLHLLFGVLFAVGLAVT